MTTEIEEDQSLVDQWADILNRNPYKVARVYLGLTQEELAGMIGVDGLSVQMIYRHENGLINTPLGTLNHELSLLSMEKGVVSSTKSFEDGYANWVHTVRTFIGSLLFVDGQHLNLLLGPRVDVNHFRAEHPFITFMNNLTWAVGIQIGVAPDLTRSQQLFNRLVCVHPKATQDYLKASQGKMGDVLKSALSDIGITVGTWQMLIQEVNLWRDLQSSGAKMYAQED